MRWWLAGMLFTAIAAPAYAGCLDELPEGSSLALRDRIAGRVDKGERSDDFQGCDYDRILVFQRGVALRCTSYRYLYAYSPLATVWRTPSGFMLCVNDMLMQVSNQ